jgi:hypothetical protein
MSHGASAPDRVLPRRSRCASAGCLFGIQRAPVCFWACRWYTNLGPEPKIRAGRVLEGVLGTPVEMLLGPDWKVVSIYVPIRVFCPVQDFWRDLTSVKINPRFA